MKRNEIKTKYQHDIKNRSCLTADFPFYAKRYKPYQIAY
ncbi:MAG: hypothetical protein ACJAUQ_001045 [Maribacter sp.]|jgi:hypothetical protein